MRLRIRESSMKISCGLVPSRVRIPPSALAKQKISQGAFVDKVEADQKLRAAGISIGANASLIAVKIFIAIITGSIAMLAEVFHSGLDLVASLLAFFGIKQASRESNHDYHYGHEKFENLSSLLQTMLIVITSVLVIYEAINRIIEPHPVDNVWVALIVMLITLVVDMIVSRYLHKVSGETNSSALEADAYHFTTDLWSAVAVIVGLVFSMFGYPVFDSIAALVVAAMMLWISWHLGAKSLDVIMDKSPPRKTVNAIAAIIDTTEGVVNHHNLRARLMGSKIIVDVHVRVKPDLTVYEGHIISHDVKKRVMQSNKFVKDVTIHIEPSKRLRL